MIAKYKYLIFTLVAFVLIYAYGRYQYRQGVLSERTKQEMIISKLNEQARLKEQELQRASDEISTKYEKEKQNAKATIDELNRDIIDGKRRLRIRTKTCIPATKNTNATTKLNGQAYAELDRQTSQALIKITNDGDEAIRQLNALQVWVNKAQLGQ